MTMILQLLVAAVAVGLGVDATLGTPPYKEYLQAMEEAAATLEKNMLSMEGNIPLLNDYRRHYAEIVYVVNYMGISESGCALVDYDKYYQEFLNTSAPYAISDPEGVVDEIRQVQVDVHNTTDELKNLIDACVQTSEICNKFIDDTVKENPDQFRHPANVLMAAGDAATDFNVLNGKFEEVSKDLKAHQYVITSPKDLEKIVFATGNLYRQLRNTPLLKC